MKQWEDKHYIEESKIRREIADLKAKLAKKEKEYKDMRMARLVPAKD